MSRSFPGGEPQFELEKQRPSSRLKSAIHSYKKLSKDLLIVSKSYGRSLTLWVYLTDLLFYMGMLMLRTSSREGHLLGVEDEHDTLLYAISCARWKLF